MKKQLWQIILLILVLAFTLCACDTSPGDQIEETTIPKEPTIETTEPEIEPNPEWFSETAIDEAKDCLFPLEGEINVELAQEILFPLVEEGNAEAQYYWGYIYDWMIVDNDGEEEKESLYWYNLAIEQGYVKSYLAAALNTYVESDERATELVEMAKQAGLFEMSPEELGPDGCELIGSYYYHKQDYYTALEWLTKSAEMGNIVGMYWLGDMYYYGYGVEKSIDVSLDWFLKAAKAGNVYAMDSYGYIYMESSYAKEIINKKYAEALTGYLEAAEAGDPVAMYNIGHMYDVGAGGLYSDEKTALNWYLKAAELGDAPSMNRLGDLYLYSYEMKDTAAALEWYLKAAELENYDACINLYCMYDQGNGVEQNAAEAQKWLEEANRILCDPALFSKNTGYLDYYQEIRDLNQEAIDWIQKAAKAGYASGMVNLGYWRYEKTFIDVDEAMGWYQSAANEGNENGMAWLAYSYYKYRTAYDSAMEWYVKAYANGYENAAEDVVNMLTKQQGLNAYFENYGQFILQIP